MQSLERFEEEKQFWERHIKSTLCLHFLALYCMAISEEFVPKSLAEIRNIIWINGSAEHKEALIEWNAKVTLLTARYDRKLKQTFDTKNEVYQLVGFFSVFHGVLLTAVAQANLLKCKHKWSPVFLSVLATLVTFWGVVQKLRTILTLEETIQKEDVSRKAAIKWIETLKKKGRSFSFVDDTPDSKLRHSGHRNLKIYTFLVLVSIVGFASLFIASFIRILCD